MANHFIPSNKVDFPSFICRPPDKVPINFVKGIVNSGRKDCALHNIGKDGWGNKVSENTSPSHWKKVGLPSCQLSFYPINDEVKVMPRGARLFEGKP